MQPKKVKNNAVRHAAGTWLVATLVAIAFPHTAFAAGLPIMIGGDGSICPAYGGFVYKIVTCMKDLSIYGLMQFITPFATYASGIMGAFIALGVFVVGAKIATGRSQHLGKDGGMFIIKAGLIVTVMTSLGTYISAIFDAMDWLLTAMASATFYSSPFCPVSSLNIWDRIDCLLEYTIGGFLSVGNLFFGITGFFVTALLSGGFGLIIGLMGIGLIALLLVGVAQCAYTFIMNCLGLSLIISVSPLFIPMMLLNVTRGFFDKWLRLLIGMMIQPAVLFAYMAMLLLAFDTVVFTSPHSIYAAVTGQSAAAGSVPFGQYVYQHGYAQKDQASWVMNVDPTTIFDLDATNKPAEPGSTQTGAYTVVPKWEEKPGAPALDWENNQVMNQLVSRNNNFPLYVTFNNVDFQNLADERGMSLQAFCMQVFISMCLALAVAYILYTMLLHVPYLSSSLAGEFVSSLSLGALSPFKQFNIGNLTKNLQSGTVQNLKAEAK